MTPRIRALVRENALCVFLAGVATATMAWLGLYGFAWSDYETEVRPAFDALMHGHVLEFLRLAPAYGGSLVERAPFALLPGLWGGGQLAVYRMVALPCLLAAAALGVWLVAHMRAAGRLPLSQAVALGLCVANPLTLRALEIGHPEDLLGGVLCVAAVLLAARGRPLWAGLALGLAIANKEWALLAVGPVLIALPPHPGAWRWRPAILCLCSAGAVAMIVLAPLRSSARAISLPPGAAAPRPQSSKPWQLFWFLRPPRRLVRCAACSAKSRSDLPGRRLTTPWFTGLSHPLIVAVSRRGARRCADAPASPWTREIPRSATRCCCSRCCCCCAACSTPGTPSTPRFRSCSRCSLGRASACVPRPAVLALSSTVLAWVSFVWLPAHVSADAQAAFFLAWSVPLGVALALRLYAPERSSRISLKTDRESIVAGCPATAMRFRPWRCWGCSITSRCAW